MKLNYKQTIWVGFAFLIICMFWQVYDTVLARVLVNSFGLNQTWSGVVLAIDNVVALVLIPVFGVISDKTKNKHGRRTPFIVAGTVLAAVIFLFVGLFTSLQDQKIATAEIQPVYTCEVVEVIPNTGKEYQNYVYAAEDGTYQVCDTNESLTSVSDFFHSIFSRVEPTYTENKTLNLNDLEEGEILKVYVFSYEEDGVMVHHSYLEKEAAADARSYFAQDIRQANIGYFIGFMVILCIVLIAMGSYRSPAVALMPDVTPKPLRSQANAVINLTGTVGGIIALLFLTFTDSDYGNHIWSFVVLSALMFVFLALFLWKVKEPKLVEKRIEEEKLYGILEEISSSVEDEAEKAKTEKAKERMPKDVKRSFAFIMVSIVLWFFAYNAATSKFSVYATNVLDTGYTMPLLVAQASAVICYIPIGLIATKIGRKKTILIGIIILFAAFLLACFITSSTAFLMYVTMAVAGIGWATINVNSFPMVVEMCKGADVGRYTGYYYTASMAAQIATPIFSGMLMDALGMTALFPYCVTFAALAFISMMFVKHGDAKPVPTSKLEALAGAEDD